VARSISSDRKPGAPPGNKNAEKPGEHESVVIRIKKPDVDLLYDFFMQQGVPFPTRAELQDAVLFAIKQVYGRRSEDQKAMIL